MKTSKILITTILLSTGFVMTNCNTSGEKLKDAQVNVMDANADLDKAREEYVVDVENFRKEANAKTAENEKSLSEFKERIKTEKRYAKADYEKRINELEQRNTDMKKRMDEYKIDTKEKWDAFKKEFSHDMDEMGNAFTDLTVKNTK